MKADSSNDITAGRRWRREIVLLKQTNEQTKAFELVKVEMKTLVWKIDDDDVNDFPRSMLTIHGNVLY